MKHQIEQLIDRLADKRHIFFSQVLEGNSCAFCGRRKALMARNELCDKNTGHPILLGNVIERLERINGMSIVINTADFGMSPVLEWSTHITPLFFWWDKCWISESLQSIFSRATWEEIAECECGAIYDLPASPSYYSCWESHRHKNKTVPREAEIRSLFEYLLTLKI